MIIGLTMIVLPVSDWAAAREWYVNKLGMQPEYEVEEDRYGEYSFGERGFVIGLWGLPKGYSVVRGDGAKMVAPTPYIEVENLEATVNELHSKGIEFEHILENGVFRTARFSDPDGHILFLYELAGG